MIRARTAASRKRAATEGPIKRPDKLVKIMGETKEPRFGPTEMMREEAMTELDGSTRPAIVTRKKGKIRLRLPPPTNAAANSAALPSRQYMVR